MKTTFKSKNAFTIVELLIVIVVIGILATLAVAGYSGVQRSALDKTALSDVDMVEGALVRYATKNNGTYVAWFSGSAPKSPELNVAPSSGNVIDVVFNGSTYCIRAYNPGAATNNTINNAATKGSSSTACATLIPSVAAGGTLAAPSSLTVVRPGNYIQLNASWSAVAGAATYRLQYSTSASFTSPTTVNNITGTTYSIVPFPQTGGQLLYVRVYALSAGGGVVSAASPTASGTTGAVSPP